MIASSCCFLCNFSKYSLALFRNISSLLLRSYSCLDIRTGGRTAVFPCRKSSISLASVFERLLRFSFRILYSDPESILIICFFFRNSSGSNEAIFFFISSVEYTFLYIFSGFIPRLINNFSAVFCFSYCCRIFSILSINVYNFSDSRLDTAFVNPALKILSSISPCVFIPCFKQVDIAKFSNSNLLFDDAMAVSFTISSASDNSTKLSPILEIISLIKFKSCNSAGILFPVTSYF